MMVNTLDSFFDLPGLFDWASNLIISFGGFALLGLAAALVVFYGSIPIFPYKARVLMALCVVLAGSGGHTVGQRTGFAAGEAEQRNVCLVKQIEAKTAADKELKRLRGILTDEIDRQKEANAILDKARRAAQAKAEAADFSKEQTNARAEELEIELEQANATAEETSKRVNCGNDRIFNRLRNR